MRNWRMVAVMPDVVFADRADAGRRLGAALKERGLAVPGGIVLGIPRGGVVVAAEVAVALGLPLGVAVARKIGAPAQPELAIGAVGPDGAAVVDARLASRVGADEAWLDDAIRAQRAAVSERVAALPERLRVPEVAGRVVIVVDDGVATGATAAAVARWLVHAGVTRRVLALPVGPPTTVARLEADYDDVVVLSVPAGFFAVGEAYVRFDQTTDDAVARLLGP
jgi:putative phosphoribosyl transferase